jgi:hypothetical protein
MIICTVCHTENDIYSTICTKCGSYLQDKVPNLDLFATIGKVIENPKEAFKLISLSEHKNYSILLFSLLGLYLIFKLLWLFQAGDKFGNLFVLIFMAILMGFPLGLLLSPITTIFHWILSKIFGDKSSLRNSLGILSYSMVPLLISLVTIVPIQLMTFGLYFFTFNPHPMTIKPELYLVIMGIEAGLIIWSFILAVIGTIVGAQISLWKSIVIIFILYITIYGCLVIGSKIVLTYI